MATRVWGAGSTAGSDGDWNTATNWTGDTLPVNGDDVVFDGTVSIASLTIKNSSYLTLNSLTWNRYIELGAFPTIEIDAAPFDLYWNDISGFFVNVDLSVMSTFGTWELPRDQAITLNDDNSLTSPITITWGSLLLDSWSSTGSLVKGSLGMITQPDREYRFVFPEKYLPSISQATWFATNTTSNTKFVFNKTGDDAEYDANNALPMVGANGEYPFIARMSDYASYSGPNTGTLNEVVVTCDTLTLTTTDASYSKIAFTGLELLFSNPDEITDIYVNAAVKIELKNGASISNRYVGTGSLATSNTLIRTPQINVYDNSSIGFVDSGGSSNEIDSDFANNYSLIYPVMQIRHPTINNQVDLNFYGNSSYNFINGQFMSPSFPGLASDGNYPALLKFYDKSYSSCPFNNSTVLEFYYDQSNRRSVIYSVNGNLMWSGASQIVLQFFNNSGSSF
jgi:hypothetical protein